MNLFIVFVGLAFGGAAEDLALAANERAAEPARMAAFERLVLLGNTDMAVVTAMSQDEDGDTRQRWVAIRTLGKIKGVRSKTILTGLLNNPQPAIRTAAATAMGDFGHKDFVEPLNMALSDAAVLVRSAAAKSVGRIGDSSSVKPLSEAVNHRRSYFRGRSLWVRRHYVEALGELGSKEAYPVLLRNIDDEDETVAKAVIESLERVSGFDFAQGRTAPQQKEAWRRYVSQQLR
jgi:HEAT repeat protein